MTDRNDDLLEIVKSVVARHLKPVLVRDLVDDDLETIENIVSSLMNRGVSVTKKAIKDGDDPTTIVVTFGRCNASAEMVEDLLRVFPPKKWRDVATEMLSRDLLHDDGWWANLLQRRDRALKKSPNPKLPSYATRITAGHQMAVAASAFDRIWGADDETLEADDETSDRDADPPEGGWTMAATAQRTYELAAGRCEAHGLHDPACPREITITNNSEWSIHHVFTREQAKKQITTMISEAVRAGTLDNTKEAKEAFRSAVMSTKVDVPSNCIVVWNRYPMGANGCHGRIHREQTSARALGLLAEKHATL